MDAEFLEWALDCMGHQREEVVTYSLYRTRDNAGDSGPMCVGLVPIYGEDGEFITTEFENNARPRVGIAMRVGSIVGRGYSVQDWWQTTVITEIIKDEPEEVHFRTGNSEYIWKEF